MTFKDIIWIVIKEIVFDKKEPSSRDLTVQKFNDIFVNNRPKLASNLPMSSFFNHVFPSVKDFFDVSLRCGSCDH